MPSTELLEKEAASSKEHPLNQSPCHDLVLDGPGAPGFPTIKKGLLILRPDLHLLGGSEGE